jgi:hypothetical protein
MSSSLSIASARQRRAAEAPPPQQRGPGTSINSQQAFAQQQVNQYPSQGFTQQQPKMQGNPNQVPAQAPQVPVGKLSIGDAFALVTIRLGRIETIIQKLEAEGVIGPNAQHNSETMEHDENMRLVDDTVIRNIVARLGDLEKGQQKIISNVQTKSETELNGEEISKLVDQQLVDFKEEFVKQVHEILDNKLSNSHNNLDQKLLEVNNQTNEIKNQVSQQISELVSHKLTDVSTQFSQQTNENQNQVSQQVSELHSRVDHSNQQVSDVQNILNDLRIELRDVKEIIGQFTSVSQETSAKVDSILFQQEYLLKKVDNNEDEAKDQDEDEREDEHEDEAKDNEDHEDEANDEAKNEDEEEKVNETNNEKM